VKLWNSSVSAGLVHACFRDLLCGNHDDVFAVGRLHGSCAQLSSSFARHAFLNAALGSVDCIFRCYPPFRRSYLALFTACLSLSGISVMRQHCLQATERRRECLLSTDFNLLPMKCVTATTSTQCHTSLASSRCPASTAQSTESTNC